ncbi:MAG: hydroxyethylthiazole kinase [Xanthobacteraceae bacterium]
MHASVEFADIAADILARVRTRAPRVHCITNSVAQQFTANVLLAAGAVPSMTISPEEVGSFVAGSDALLVNLGTFDIERRAAINAAIGAAKAGRKPWVLDPVFVERAPPRAQFARDVLTQGPAVVRLNTAEFATLSGDDRAGDAPARLAKGHATVVALTGGVDRVTDGTRHAVIANGDPLMGLVTAIGCAGSALVAAALAVETDSFVAASATLTAFGVAGEVAARDVRGPGSFAGAIIDALYSLDRATLRQRARVS